MRLSKAVLVVHVFHLKPTILCGLVWSRTFRVKCLEFFNMHVECNLRRL